MKTVELKIGNQTAQFTTKSLTYNGREYFYSRMTGVANDPVNITMHSHMTVRS